MIELRTLGALELISTENGAVGSVLAQPRRAALLCYLALATPRGFHRRDTLFSLFWPEYDAEQARHALRQSVYVLRRALGATTIVSRGDEELALAPERISCDVWALDAAIDQGRPAEALALYRGELLAGFHISDAPEFERWLDQERSRLRQRAGAAGWGLAAEREREGDAAGAVEAARRAVAFSPTDETALRRLMLLLERVGDRAAAVRAYEAFAWTLEDEYELEPSAETQAVVARIRAESGESQMDALVHGRGSAPARGGSSARIGNGNSGAGARAAASSTVPRLDPANLGRDELRFGEPVTPPSPTSFPFRGLGPAAIVTAAMVILLLIGLAGLYRQTRTHRSLGPPLTPAIEAAPGIAVLPFAIQHDSLANWREGLLDLVSIDLGGVAGLRPVDSRTLLARWRERVEGSDIPELATALDVAERAGARYAVVGRVIADGPDLLLIAGVHELTGRRMLGTVRSQGPADSVFSLVDRLTVEILRLILSGEAPELPRIDLARVSTASLPALKSYLEGEGYFRRSQFQSAAEAYTRAVDADSTFALARYRLGLSWWWSLTDTNTIRSGPHPFYSEVAPIADRLPRHEAAMFRAILLREQDVRAARESLEAEVRRHPDDAETWNELGELYYHSGHQALVPPEQADRAFATAIKLDSTFTLPYMHRIDHAISTGDGTGAARFLRTFARLAPGSPFIAHYDLVIRLAFGDSIERATAETALDTVESRDVFWAGIALEGQRCCWGRAEQVLRKVRERGELRSDATRLLFWVSLSQGKAREALGWLDDPFMPQEPKGLMLQVLDEFGVQVPAARLDSALKLQAADTRNAVHLFAVGAYAASRARWDLLRGVLERLQTRQQHLRAVGDSSETAFTEAVQQALEGYAWWRRGQRENALRLLESSQRRAVGDWRRETVNLRLRWWVGRLLVEMGRPKEALPYFESLTSTWLAADYERGRLYEQLGMTTQAGEAYALFLERWQQADPVFQPMIQRSRTALDRLAVATTE